MNKKIILATSLLFVGLNAGAQEAQLPELNIQKTQDERSSVSIGYGQYDNQKQISFAYTSPVVWTRQLENSRLTLRLEGQIAQWEYGGDNDIGDNRYHRHLTQVSVVPLFSWELSENFSLKGGIGLAYFDNHRFGDKYLGSKLNFADILGMGYRLSSNSEIAYYYTHYSNAGIKKPNPGLDMHKIVYNYSF